MYAEMLTFNASQATTATACRDDCAAAATPHLNTRRRQRNHSPTQSASTCTPHIAITWHDYTTATNANRRAPGRADELERASTRSRRSGVAALSCRNPRSDTAAHQRVAIHERQAARHHSTTCSNARTSHECPAQTPIRLHAQSRHSTHTTVHKPCPVPAGQGLRSPRLATQYMWRRQPQFTPRARRASGRATSSGGRYPRCACACRWQSSSSCGPRACWGAPRRCGAGGGWARTSWPRRGCRR